MSWLKLEAEFTLRITEKMPEEEREDEIRELRLLQEPICGKHHG